MTKDSRAEILIVGGALLLLFFFWQRNRTTQGNGTTFNLLPVAGASTTNGGVPLSLTMPGDSLIPLWNPPAIPATVFDLSSAGGCGCSTNGNGGPTYGSADALAAGLLGQGYDMPMVNQESVY